MSKKVLDEVFQFFVGWEIKGSFTEVRGVLFHIDDSEVAALLIIRQAS